MHACKGKGPCKKCAYNPAKNCAIAMANRHKVKASEISSDSTEYKFMYLDNGKTSTPEQMEKLSKVDTFTYMGWDKNEYAVDLRDLKTQVLDKMNALESKKYASTKLKMDENDFGRAMNDAVLSAKFKKSDAAKIELDITEKMIFDEATSSAMKTVHTQPALVIATSAQTPAEFDDMETECCVFFAQHGINCEDDLIEFIKKHNTKEGSKKIEDKFEKCAEFCKTCTDKRALTDSQAAKMSMQPSWKDKLAAFAKTTGKALLAGGQILLKYGAKLFQKLVEWGAKVMKHVAKYVQNHPAVLVWVATSMKTFKEWFCYKFKNEPWMLDWGLVEEVEKGTISKWTGVDQSTINQGLSNAKDLTVGWLKTIARTVTPQNVMKKVLDSGVASDPMTRGAVVAAAAVLPEDAIQRGVDASTQSDFANFLLDNLKYFASWYVPMPILEFVLPLVKWAMMAVFQVFMKKFFEDPNVLIAMDIMRSLTGKCQKDKLVPPPKDLHSSKAITKYSSPKDIQKQSDANRRKARERMQALHSLLENANGLLENANGLDFALRVHASKAITDSAELDPEIRRKRRMEILRAKRAKKKQRGQKDAPINLERQAPSPIIILDTNDEEPMAQQLTAPMSLDLNTSGSEDESSPVPAEEENVSFGPDYLQALKRRSAGSKQKKRKGGYTVIPNVTFDTYVYDKQDGGDAKSMFRKRRGTSSTNLRKIARNPTAANPNITYFPKSTKQLSRSKAREIKMDMGILDPEKVAEVEEDMESVYYKLSKNKDTLTAEDVNMDRLKPGSRSRAVVMELGVMDYLKKRKRPVTPEEFVDYFTDVALKKQVGSLSQQMSAAKDSLGNLEKGFRYTEDYILKTPLSELPDKSLRRTARRLRTTTSSGSLKFLTSLGLMKYQLPSGKFPIDGFDGVTVNPELTQKVENLNKTDQSDVKTAMRLQEAVLRASRRGQGVLLLQNKGDQDKIDDLRAQYGKKGIPAEIAAQIRANDPAQAGRINALRQKIDQEKQKLSNYKRTKTAVTKTSKDSGASESEKNTAKTKIADLQQKIQTTKMQIEDLENQISEFTDL